MQKNMFNKMIVYEALKKSLSSDSGRNLGSKIGINGQDGLISLLIHDVFGGDILKTHSNKYWHFYNRIEGERVDFTEEKSQDENLISKFEDIPSSPDETNDYVDQADYTTFFTKFVNEFEDTIGLEKYHPGLSA
jgi:hypothetical protein